MCVFVGRQFFQAKIGCKQRLAAILKGDNSNQASIRSKRHLAAQKFANYGD